MSRKQIILATRHTAREMRILRATVEMWRACSIPNMLA